MGVWYFPNIFKAAEPLNVHHSDLEALLGGEPCKQAAVIDKIQTFFKKVTQRTIANIVHMRRTSELADMWYSKDHPNEMQEKCEEIWICML